MKSKIKNETMKIAVIGLGYVGLPLALKFSEKFDTVGFDLDSERISELASNFDRNGEELNLDSYKNKNLKFTDSPLEISSANFIVITVPTPVSEDRKPDLSILISATKLVGKYLQDQAVVVYESTVYPGCTREVCVPILEKQSGKILNKGFYCGYSPERINPGKGNKTIGEIVKVVSGSNEYTRELCAELYSRIVEAGVHIAPSIEVAEASKVIENVQRDVNIALMNELAQLFSVLNLNTQDILEAANTKWNFLPFTPGLVGGHCISVDPYYLNYKALDVGFETKLLLLARKINDSRPGHIVTRVMDELEKSCRRKPPRVLICGLSFKENCNDLRNSLAINVVQLLRQNEVNVCVFDPLLENLDEGSKTKLGLTFFPEKSAYDAIIFTVFHDHFADLDFSFFHSLLSNKGRIFDVKSSLPKSFNAVCI